MVQPENLQSQSSIGLRSGWSAGSVCVFEMVECLCAAVESALVVGATKEGTLGGTIP